MWQAYNYIFQYFGTNLHWHPDIFRPVNKVKLG